MTQIEFETLAQSMEKLEATSSQSEMVGVLSDVLKKATKDEIDKVCYFILGRIYAGYKDSNLGVGESLAQAAISLAGGVERDRVEERTRELGDLGNVARGMIGTGENEFKEFFECQGKLSVSDVAQGLRMIAGAGGSGSEEIRKKTLAAMLMESDRLSKKYITRLAIGKMRLGVGDMTVLDALAAAYLGSKEERPKLEHAYNVCSDIGHVAQILVKSGLKGIKRIRIALNRPLKPMLAQRVSKLSDIRDKIKSERIAAEEKYDGERVQAHKDGDKVSLFSRRLTNVTGQFPEIVENVRKHVSVKKAVLDGEAVAYNFQKDEFYQFQKLMQRRRKYDVKEYAEKIPVKYMLFDVLYIDGNSMMRKSYPERRKKLREISKNRKYIALTGRKVSSSLDKIDDFFQECLERGLEGIVCKSCAKTSRYRAGAREWSWIKWKKGYVSELSDTLDLAVIGAYAGRGRRGGGYGALLCAAYNHEEDTFQTVCKLGTGFSDEELKGLPERLKEFKLDEEPARVEVTEEMKPDYWFQPRAVVEVMGSEITRSPTHTCGRRGEGKGLGLRFPRFERWRPEKSPEQATYVEDVEKMYES